MTLPWPELWWTARGDPRIQRPSAPLSCCTRWSALALASTPQAHAHRCAVSPKVERLYADALVLDIAAVSRQPSAVSRQPPAASRQPPAVSRQPPAASRQPSAVSRQPSAASRQPPAASRQPSAARMPAAGRCNLGCLHRSSAQQRTARVGYIGAHCAPRFALAVARVSSCCRTAAVGLQDQTASTAIARLVHAGSRQRVVPAWLAAETHL
ncbi:hypothetical protein FHY19_000694 [Xanthomonas arboricola]|nr:hypothetical protein [Xanthomonas sp. 4461]